MKRFFFIGLLVAACSSSTEEPAGDDKDVVNVTVRNTEFSPASVSIKVGQTVRWTWGGGEHTVTSGTNCTRDEGFRSSQLQAGGTHEFKFEKAGTFPYFCEPHCQMGMKGQVVVTEN